MRVLERRKTWERKALCKAAQRLENGLVLTHAKSHSYSVFQFESSEVA